MSYSDFYRNAMEKAAPCEAWKSETIEKMKSIQTSAKQRKPVSTLCFTAFRHSMIPLASAALIALVFFYSNSDFLFPLLAASSNNTPYIASFSADDAASTQAQASPINRGRSIAILPNIIEADTPEQALPNNICPLDDAFISSEQYEQAILLLENQLMEQSQNGTLPVVLTPSDIAAQGYFSANDTISVVFALPATSLGENLYYVYEIPLI